MAEEQQTLAGVVMTADEKRQVSTSGFQKPIFEKMTKGKIVKCETIRRPEPHTDAKGKKFLNVYFQVSMQVEGLNDLVVENYGYKIYQNDNGLSAYIGPKGEAGKLKALLMEYFNLKANASIEEIEQCMVGKTALFKTGDVTTPDGEVKKKQLIKQFEMDVK